MLIKMDNSKHKKEHGIRLIMGAFPLFLLGPILISSALNNKTHELFYLVLIIGIIVCISAVLLFFFGILKLVKGLSNDPN